MAAALVLMLAQNLLVVVADDIHTDFVEVYQTGPRYRQPPTPNMDQLARSGVWFRNAHSHPACSTTRSSLLTGLNPFRTGIGSAIQPSDPTTLDAGEVTVLERLAGAGYTTAMVGKWHLGGNKRPLLEPIRHGLDLFVGTRIGARPDYWSFDQRLVVPWVDQPLPPTLYSTTELTDHALALINTMAEPWCLVLNYHAAHDPFHVPPQPLHSYGWPQADEKKYEAMVEALDTELGRLVQGADLADTTLFFLADNGTAASVATDPNRAKGSLYQGGIQVPLMVAGAGVTLADQECQALVGVTDLYATLLELAGVPGMALDSVSFAPALVDPAFLGRAALTAERFQPNGKGPKTQHERMARDDRFKIIRDVLTGQEDWFDLVRDPTESRPLDPTRLPPEVRAVFAGLQSLLDSQPRF